MIRARSYSSQTRTAAIQNCSKRSTSLSCAPTKSVEVYRHPSLESINKACHSAGRSRPRNGTLARLWRGVTKLELQQFELAIHAIDTTLHVALVDPRNERPKGIDDAR